jgi:hypothetical protein
MTPAVVGLDVAGTPDAWHAAGFAVAGDEFAIGAVRVRCRVGERGIASWTLAGVTSIGAIDGLATSVVEAAPAGHAAPAEHPNGALLVDHVVVYTPDGPRTTRALEAVGMEVRRVRDDARPGVVQTFFRAGEVIVEVVAPPEPDPDAGAARFFGIAVTVADLDRCASLLGDACSDVRPAVQPGRRIATLRHRDIGLPVAVAYMSA